MAATSFNDYLNSVTPKGAQTKPIQTIEPTKSPIQFFALDSEPTTVSFDLHSVDDLVIHSVHNIKNKYNKRITVSCLHEEHIDDACCPFCASVSEDKKEWKKQYRAFIKLLRYNEDGTTTPCVWNASPTLVASQLYQLLQKNGDISGNKYVIQKIEGQTPFDVKYTITQDGFCTTTPDYSIFDTFDLSNIVKQKTAEDMLFFLEHEFFPSYKTEEKVETLDIPSEDFEELAQPIVSESELKENTIVETPKTTESVTIHTTETTEETPVSHNKKYDYHPSPI